VPKSEPRQGSDTGSISVSSDKGNGELLKQERLLEGIAKRQSTASCENQRRGNINPTVSFNSTV